MITSKWTDKEIEQLKELLDLGKTAKEIAKKMDRTVKAVETRIQKLGLSKIVRTRWSKNEEKRLKNLAPNHTLKELSDLFGNRSIYSIEHKIKELGISYNKIKNKLTEEDIKYIEENYQEKTITELAAHLKVGTTLITSCAKSLGLSKDKVTKWTPEELKRLQELALTKNVNELASEFNTSPRGITAIAGKNNIKLLSSIHMWTDEEVEKLKKLNGEGKTIVEIQEELNIDGDSIRSKLHKLKLPINRSLTTWTEDELNTLLIKYEELSNNYTGSKYEFLCKISEELPKKGILAIEHKLSALKKNLIGNATNLSKEDINNIKELCETKTTEEIMHIYKCTRNQIARYVKNTQANKNRSWTKKDDDLITELSKTKTPVEIATIINKSAASVEDRLKVLKVIKAKKIYWSPEAVNKLKDLWGNHPIEEISKQLNIDVSSIVFKARILSLPSYYDSLDGMTIKEVAALLGITSDKISTTWFNLGLNIRTKVISQGTSIKYINFIELLAFLRCNRDIWDASRIDEDYLCDLPDWVHDKYENDRNSQLNTTATTKKKLLKINKNEEN